MAKMKDFLQGPKPELHQKFSDDCFLMCWSFLMNIFGSANFVNLELQGKETNLIYCQEKLSAFNMKLTLGHFKLQNKSLLHFLISMLFLMKMNLTSTKVFSRS